MQLLHGVCYAFFFATLYIFIDEYLPQDIRTSAQGLFNMLIFGFGPLVANTYGPQLKTLLTQGTGPAAVVDWQKLFLIPCGAALLALVLLAVCFHPPGTGKSQATEA